MPQSSLIIGGGGMATMSTPGTAWRVSTTSKPCVQVDFKAVSTNTGPMFICNSTVLTATTGRVGIPVYPGSTSPAVSIYCMDVNQLYIDGVSTEAVSYIYYLPVVGVA